MHIDFNGSGNTLPALVDVCVVGSGPAGMTVALELERAGRSVLLLEGGGLERSEESQDVDKGDVIGDSYFKLDHARLRYLGWTSCHCGGWCMLLGERDFQKKEGFEDTQWPIEKKDLDPFLERALAILDVPPPRQDVVLDREFGINETSISVSRVRFGEKYRERLNASKNLIYVTSANLTGLKTDGQQVVGATVTNYAGHSASVKAKRFILAMGGIENSRMLLWWNQQANGKLVDARAPLGRYWMEHPTFAVGHALVDVKIPKTDYYIPHLLLNFTDEVKRKLAVLDCIIKLQEIPSEGTKGLLKDLACVAPKAGEWAASLAGKNIVCGAKLLVGWEQEPVWSNHVQLSDTKRDRFGIPLTELHWKKTERDRLTMQKSLSHFNEYLMAGNHGRLKLEEWVFGNGSYPVREDEGGSWHHMGGTRMAHRVQQGVVDSDCRVFGQNNLYVAGSSVFPSGGAVNPTLTIVQLALRLADHLRSA